MTARTSRTAAGNTNATRKLPAFARELMAKRYSGLAPIDDLVIACDWRIRDEHVGWRIVVPPTDDPEALDFTVVAGLSCLLLARDEARLDQVATAVAKFDPRRLVGVAYDVPRIRVYVAAPAVETRR